jgi:hypothetical protein
MSSIGKIIDRKGVLMGRNYQTFSFFVQQIGKFLVLYIQAASDATSQTSKRLGFSSILLGTPPSASCRMDDDAAGG